MTVDLYAEEQRAETPKKRLFTPFGVVIAVAALVMIAVVAWGINDSLQEQPRSGPAPEFDLPLIVGDGNFALEEQRGQVVVINFWGSWCGPCRVEAPMLQDIYERYADEGVIFVGIAVKDTPTAAQEYIAEFGITYPNVMDLGGRMEQAYRTQGVPETFVVGRDGEITEFFFATPREADLIAAIEEALES